MQDTQTGETVASVSDTGGEDDLLGLVSKIGSHVRSTLGMTVLSAGESAGVRASLPSSTDAIRLYAQGLERYRLFDTVGARDLLVKAVEADPSNAVAHSALAAAWTVLGYDVKAQSEAKHAADLAAALPREQRLAVEARYRALAGDSEKAIDSYRGAAHLFPDDLDYGLELARFQTARGYAKDGSRPWPGCEKLPPRSETYPRLDSAAATTNSSLGNLSSAHAAADRGSAAGRGASHGAARGRGPPAGRRRALAHVEIRGALAACAEASRLAHDAGDGTRRVRARRGRRLLFPAICPGEGGVSSS